MIHTANTVRMLRILACILSLILIFWVVNFVSFVTEAEAEDIMSASTTISDSHLAAVANHSIAFTPPNGLNQGQTIVVTFDAGFTLPGVGFDFNDMDLATGTDEVLGSSAAAGVWGVSTATSSITFTTPTNYGVASATPITIEVGTHATAGATGDSQITNPTSTNSYPIDIGGTMQDSGQVRVYILDDVLVTASVDATFTFVVSGTSTGVVVNGSPTVTSTTTTSTALPFGTLVASTPKVIAQDLAVTTNAVNGFTVTVQQRQDLQSSNGAVIDSFVDGNYTNSPTVWTSPTNSSANAATWGHWGLTSTDDLNTDEFGSNLWVAASTTPREVFHHASPADGVTSNEGTATVGYQVEITALQEAGDDYNTELVYVATPIF